MLPESQSNENTNDTYQPFQDDVDIENIVKNILDGKIQDSSDSDIEEDKDLDK